MSSLFRFKKFQVDQTGTTMKINTDGVLLGALAEHLPVKRILDIGTGTGVIALMMAQRYPNASVDAIEKDEDTAALAHRNFLGSTFSSQLKAYSGSFQEFNPAALYDLIISNPPFFLNALQNPDKRKSDARHTHSGFFDALIDKAASWLRPGGSLQLVLPPKIAHYVLEQAKMEKKLNHFKTIYLKSFSESEPFRQIIFLMQNEQSYSPKHREYYFTLYDNKGVYSAQYRSLLQPFFLNF